MKQTLSDNGNWKWKIEMENGTKIYRHSDIN